MTDKQIIDEERIFECVWCKYDFKESNAHFILSEKPNECVCSNCMTEWADNLLCDFKRKEQECEELKRGYAELTETVSPYMDDFTGYNEELGGFDLALCVKELMEQLDQLKAENDELKKQACGLRPELKYIINKTCCKYNINAKYYHEKIIEIINNLDKLKQTLTEIKPILEFYANSTLGEKQKDGSYKLEWTFSDVFPPCSYIKYDPNPAKEALRKISEVEDGFHS